jgi:hypothetical protein
MITRLGICIACCLLTSTILLSACALDQRGPNDVSADFDQFYRAHGAEEVLGTPIGKPIIIDALLSVRCYVGGCLQRHAARNLGGRITLSPLPEEMRQLQPPTAESTDTSGLLFRETGHYIQSAFRRYFELHGGVRFFGYPLGPLRARSDHQLTQRFERATLIWDNSLPSEQSVYLEPIGHIIYANLTGEIENDLKPKSEAEPESFPTNAAIAAFVQAHRDWVVFGEPLSQPDTAADGLIEQVFTNVVVVADPHSPGGARLRPLGILAYGRADTAQPPSDVPGAAYFPSTGHSVLAAFKTYYDLHGSESIFGAPISEAFVENGALTQYFENLALVWRQEGYGHGIPSVVPKELGLAYARGMPSTLSMQPAAAVQHTVTDFAVHAWATLPFALPQDRQEINVLVMDLQSHPIAGAIASLELDTSQGANRLLLPATGPDGRTSVTFPVSMVGEKVPTANYRVSVEVGSARETVAKSFNIQYLGSQ